MSTVKADNFTWKTGETSAQYTPSITGEQLVRGVARGWINFGYPSSVLTTRASFNFSSVIRNGVGDYTLSYTNAFYLSNHACIVGGCGDASSEGAWNTSSNAPTTNTNRIRCFSSAGSGQDQTAITAAVHV